MCIPFFDAFYFSSWDLQGKLYENLFFVLIIDIIDSFFDVQLVEFSVEKMQRGGSGRNDFLGGFGDPFGDEFGGFPGFGGRPGSLISSFFGGRSPFDDPFFTQPFGGMMGPGMMGPGMFGPSMFGPRGGPSMFGPRGGLFGEPSNAGFLEQQASPPPNKSKGPVIKELSSDGEEEEDNEGNRIADGKKDNQRKHFRSSNEPYVQDPDEEVEGTCFYCELILWHFLTLRN